MTVRLFTPVEWRTYRQLRLRALAESPDSFGSTLAREVALPESYWRDRLASAAVAENELPLLALAGDTPAGLTWGRIADETPDVAHVYQVWVAPEHRGRGLGRLLLETVIAWARASEVRAVELDVTVTNSAAVQLYRGLGFLETGDSKPLRDSPTLRSQVMRLVLDAG